jgi:heptosyltransferase-2
MTHDPTGVALVVFAPNWLGDAVMALPAIADVRRARPAARIAVGARPGVAPLFHMVDGIDEVVTLERSRWRVHARELGGRRFGTALLLPNSLQSAVLARQANIPQRWGYRSDCRGPLLTRGVERPRGLHQVDSYRRLVEALGFPNGERRPRVSVSPESRAAASTLLRMRGWNGVAPLAAIAPGAAYGGAKRWAPESFAALASAWANDGVDVVMVGSASDRETGDCVARAFVTRTFQGRDARTTKRGALHDLMGATDLQTLAGMFAICRALVSNDSGAMHLAAAIGTPVTAVFGPTNERATAPVGEEHAIIVGDAWCRPCMLRECPIDHRCMRTIGAATVVGVARRSL